MNVESGQIWVIKDGERWRTQDQWFVMVVGDMRPSADGLNNVVVPSIVFWHDGTFTKVDVVVNTLWRHYKCLTRSPAPTRTSGTEAHPCSTVPGNGT